MREIKFRAWSFYMGRFLDIAYLDITNSTVSGIFDDSGGYTGTERYWQTEK